MTPTDEGRAPTLHDVARRAGVAVSTASRALGNKPHVSDERRRRVREAATELGYRPNVTARSLRTARSMTIGLVMHSMTSPVMMRLLNGLSEAVDSADYTLLLTDAHGSHEAYSRLLPRLFERRVDALFLANPDLVSSELDMYRAAGIPMLALVSRGAACSDIPLVNVSSMSASATASARFAELGHRRAAMLFTPITRRTDFASALEGALQANGIACDLYEVGAGGPELAIHQLLEAIAAGESPPTLAFARYQDALALVELCNRERVAIPDDLSICSITDDETLTPLRTPIAALASDTHALGQRSAQIMFDAMRGSTPPNVTSLDLMHWVERESVGPARPA